MKLEFNSKNTKVQQLTDFIRRSIAAHELGVGDKLPSINEMSRHFHLSRDTVFKAYSDLKKLGIIDSVQSKSYYVTAGNRDILLLLDEYTPFKEVLYKTLRNSLPLSYNIDLWFHQYKAYLFGQIIHNASGMYNKYIVMNYHNEQFSDELRKIDKKKLLLIDFGKFDKNGYSYVCQDFDQALFDALVSIVPFLQKYRKLFFVFNREHKHPQSSKEYFSRFCLTYNFPFEIIDEVNEKTTIQKNAFYLVIKQEDMVELIKQGKKDHLKVQRDYGLLAYNDNPFYEIIETGISSIGIDWQKMGTLIARFIITNEPVQLYLPTQIIRRNSF